MKPLIISSNKSFIKKVKKKLELENIKSRSILITKPKLGQDILYIDSLLQVKQFNIIFIELDNLTKNILIPFVENKNKSSIPSISFINELFNINSINPNLKRRLSQEKNINMSLNIHTDISYNEFSDLFDSNQVINFMEKTIFSNKNI